VQLDRALLRGRSTIIARFNSWTKSVLLVSLRTSLRAIVSVINRRVLPVLLGLVRSLVLFRLTLSLVATSIRLLLHFPRLLLLILLLLSSVRILLHLSLVPVQTLALGWALREPVYIGFLLSLVSLLSVAITLRLSVGSLARSRIALIRLALWILSLGLLTVWVLVLPSKNIDWRDAARWSVHLDWSSTTAIVSLHLWLLWKILLVLLQHSVFTVGLLATGFVVREILYLSLPVAFWRLILLWIRILLGRFCIVLLLLLLVVASLRGTGLVIVAPTHWPLGVAA